MRESQSRSAPTVDPSAAALDVRIPHTRFTLANGLDVLVHRDPSVPVAGVNLWYHVGSRNERPGRTGLAHLFEHLMFEGSAHVPEGAYDRILESVGGVNNGSTSNDRTNYWSTVPSSAVELAVWLEADRMGFLLEAMTQEKLDLQRDVVKNERRETVENQPYGLAFETVARALYPADHPYHWPVIGSMADLSATTLEDVRAFFRTWYAPGNASLAVAGDVDPEEVRRSVERWFGDLPAGPPRPETPVPAAALTAERRLHLEDDVQLPRLYMAWHAPECFAPDDAALEVLASILSDGKDSRLHRRLVYQDRLAQDVSVFQHGQEAAGSFWIVVTARPGQPLGPVEETLREELERVVAEGVQEEELLRAVRGVESDFVRALERVGGFGGKADRLNEYLALTGDPGFAGQDLARYAAVGPDEVARAVRRWITGCPAVRLGVVPRGRTELAPEGTEAAPPPPDLVTDGDPGGSPVSASPPAPDPASPAAPPDPRRLTPPPVAPPPPLHLPEVQAWSLDNGLRVLLVERRDLPVVSAQLLLPGGASAHDPARAGLAALTADMLDEGTESRSALEIAGEVELLGARLGSSAGYDASGVRLTLLRPTLARGLDLVADVIRNPTFPAEELERVRAERRARVLQRADDPASVADDVFVRTVYGTAHPYGATLLGTDASLAELGREEVHAFHAHRYRPGGSTLLVVGDVGRSELEDLLEGSLARWAGTADPVPAVPPAAPDARPGASRIVLVDRPGAPQSEIRVGRAALTRRDPRYHRAAVANTILGGSFTSRLNTLLREEKGYTYGAWSWFDLRRGAGPFAAQTAVDTPVTADAVGDILAEMDRLAVSPVPEEELGRARSWLALRLPQRFESTTDVVGRLSELVLHHVPLTFYEDYVDAVLAVDADAVLSFASHELRSQDMVVVVTGDRTAVQAPLEALGLGPVEIVPAPAGGTP